jgi:hypothetical protein
MTTQTKSFGYYRAMPRNLILGLIVALSPPLHAQSPPNTTQYTRQNIAQILGFELRGSGDLPAGWSGGPAGTIAADNGVVHSGHWAARLDRSAHPSGNFSTMTSRIPIDFTGGLLPCLSPTGVDPFVIRGQVHRFVQAFTWQ